MQSSQRAERMLLVLVSLSEACVLLWGRGRQDPRRSNTLRFRALRLYLVSRHGVAISSFEDWRVELRWSSCGFGRPWAAKGGSCRVNIESPVVPASVRSCTSSPHAHPIFGAACGRVCRVCRPVTFPSLLFFCCSSPPLVEPGSSFSLSFTSLYVPAVAHETSQRLAEPTPQPYRHRAGTRRTPRPRSRVPTCRSHYHRCYHNRYPLSQSRFSCFLLAALLPSPAQCI